MADSPLDEIDEHQWDEACRRSDAIRKFLKRSPDDSSTGGGPRLAAELGVSRATAYRLIKRFRADDTAISLVDRKRGRPDGHRTLDDRREEIIRKNDCGFLSEAEPADILTTCARCADPLHIGWPQAPALAHNQSAP
jgi:putative transposase